MAAQYPQSYSDPFALPALRSVAVRNASFADKVLDGLTSSDEKERGRSIDVLVALPNIAALTAKEPSRFEKIVGFPRVLLLEYVCTAESRNLVAPMVAGVDAAYDPLPEIDKCIARRKQLEPAFRAWLAPKRRK